jgi:hypothetical protein
MRCFERLCLTQEIEVSMNKFFVAMLGATLLSAGGWSMTAAADAQLEPLAKGMQTKPDSSHQTMGNMSGSEMMGEGIKGMGTMGSCPMMSQLPAGNDAVAMRMHGEMMQAMGGILIKYADKIQQQQPK